VSGVAASYREYKLTFGEMTKFGDLTFGEVTFGEMAFGDLTFVKMTSKTSNAKESKHCTILLLLCRSALGLRCQKYWQVTINN